jgi:hypothetical protein
MENGLQGNAMEEGYLFGKTEVVTRESGDRTSQKELEN